MGCNLSAVAVVDQGEKASLVNSGKEISAYFTSNMRSYSFNELQAATGKFSPDRFLGGGGFGGVFKGWIHYQTFAPSKCGKGIPVAVKLLDFHSLQGHKEWMAEIYYLGHLQHPNIIKLMGYCAEEDQRLLVYEFMSGGSMDSRLFYNDGGEPLSWRLRMKIALEAARGLAYLHSQKISIIFRDFKASNILLDLECNVKLSDFGLAKDGPEEDGSYVSTQIMGTFGYADPDYIESGRLTSKSDVYSFGVVLLEILSGRRVIDEDRPVKEQNLITWTRPYLHNNRKVFKVMDPRIQGQYSITQALTIANIATGCLSIKPELRPTMDDIVSELEQLQD